MGEVITFMLGLSLGYYVTASLWLREMERRNG